MRPRGPSGLRRRPTAIRRRRCTPRCSSDACSPPQGMRHRRAWCRLVRGRPCAGTPSRPPVHRPPPAPAGRRARFAAVATRLWACAARPRSVARSSSARPAPSRRRHRMRRPPPPPGSGRAWRCARRWPRPRGPRWPRCRRRPQVDRPRTRDRMPRRCRRPRPRRTDWCASPRMRRRARRASIAGRSPDRARRPHPGCCCTKAACLPPRARPPRLERGRLHRDTRRRAGAGSRRSAGCSPA